MPFEITDIEVTATETVLTWNSRPGREYSIEINDGVTGWIEYTDGVPSQGDTTSEPVPRGLGETRQFYRILEL